MAFIIGLSVSSLLLCIVPMQGDISSLETNNSASGFIIQAFIKYQC